MSRDDFYDLDKLREEIRRSRKTVGDIENRCPFCSGTNVEHDSDCVLITKPWTEATTMSPKEWKTFTESSKDWIYRKEDVLLTPFTHLELLNKLKTLLAKFVFDNNQLYVSWQIEDKKYHQCLYCDHFFLIEGPEEHEPDCLIQQTRDLLHRLK